jgi:hypothetical protein
MLRKLMLFISASVVFGGLFSSTILAGTPGKITPQRIPLNQVAPSSPAPVTDDKGFCLIQSDSLTESVYYFPDLTAGDGFVLYVDPAKCGLPDPYPFKITDVHFYIHGWTGYAPPVWPVEIQVNVLNLSGGVKCNGPGNLLCSQTFSIPIDSSDDLLQRPMNLTIDSLCITSSPFFLEIKYTGGTTPPYPSLFVTDETDPPDTCNAWVLRHEDGLYHEWYTFWGAPVPGYPIIRTTGYTNSTAVEEEETGITPKDFALYQSYPNPFNNQTIIKYDLVKPCQVTLTIYNILGQKVRTLVDEPKMAGDYEVVWDGKDEKGKDLASGIYFYQLKAGDVTQTKRMALLK